MAFDWIQGGKPAAKKALSETLNKRINAKGNYENEVGLYGKARFKDITDEWSKQDDKRVAKLYSNPKSQYPTKGYAGKSAERISKYFNGDALEDRYGKDKSKSQSRIKNIGNANINNAKEYARNFEKTEKLGLIRDKLAGGEYKLRDIANQGKQITKEDVDKFGLQTFIAGKGNKPKVDEAASKANDLITKYFTK